MIVYFLRSPELHQVHHEHHLPELWSANVELDMDYEVPRAWLLRKMTLLGKQDPTILNTNPKNIPWLHRGFMDSHLHVTWLGEQQRRVIGDRFNNLEDFADALIRQMKTTLPGEILISYGFDEERWGVTLSKVESLLDEQMPKGSLWVVYRVCGHSALVSRDLKNSLALTIDGLWVDDRSLPELQSRLPAPQIEQVENDFLEAQKILLASGITAVGDMSLNETLFRAVKNLSARGQLKLDYQGVYLDQQVAELDFGGPFLSKEKASPTFEVRHWKRYLDGSFGSHTAWLRASYKDRNNEFGLNLYSTNELIESSEKALNRGFALSFHAIGDAALHQIIELSLKLKKPMADLNQKYGLNLHRIEHAQLAGEDQIKTLKELNLWTFCLQPSHRVADEVFIKNRLGEDRCFEDAYRLGSFLEAGMPCTLGSDAPIVGHHPLLSLDASMKHPNPKERVSEMMALWICTEGARRAHGLPVKDWCEGQRVWLMEPRSKN